MWREQEVGHPILCWKGQEWEMGGLASGGSHELKAQEQLGKRAWSQLPGKELEPKTCQEFVTVLGM